PFARQIYMIGRKTFDQRQDRWVVKQTIQTGIDGYRLIGRRAADRARQSISVGAPEWAREDGTWVPVWSAQWGTPMAARVTIKRNGEPFTAVALFDEYKQVKRNGDLTQMWAQRPAGQIAKCAEALAWRMAFPQDLAGVYVEDEMQHADGAPQGTPAGPRRESAADLLAAAPAPEAPPADTAPAPAPTADEAPGEPAITSAQSARMGTLMKEMGLNRAAALAFVGGITGRTVQARNELTEAEADKVIAALEQDATEAANGDAAPPDPATDADEAWLKGGES